MKRNFRLLSGCLVLVTTIACAASERQRPIEMSPVAEGPNSLAMVRQQLAGQWVLVSLNVTAPNGKRADVDATGRLTSDAFGGLEIEYRMSEGGQKTLAGLGVATPNPVISTSGQVAIDPAQKKVTYVGEGANARPFDADLAARRGNPFALERVRYYEFAADGGLTLRTRYDDGKDAMVSRWKKAQ